MSVWKQPGMQKKIGIGLAVCAILFGCVLGIQEGKKEPEVIKSANESENRESSGLIEEEELELLSALYHAVSEKKYAETADLLNKNEEILMHILETTFNEKRYCYWETEYEDGKVIRHMEPLETEGEMKGMVLMRFNTLFYGTYTDGKPDGECTAVQAMVLDEPRYTFAEGIWKAGKMNGNGKTGYHYYQDAPVSGYVMTEKNGNYQDNLLDGIFTYQTESDTGEKLSWKLKAKAGVTVIDERWKHYPARNEYMIASEENSAKVYVLSEDKDGTVLWNNLILWDEKT